MNKNKLILVGILPLILGYLYNYAVMTFNLSGALMLAMSVLFFIIWGIMSKVCSFKNENPLVQSFYLNLVGLIMLVLFLIGRSIHILYLIPQFYYMPGMSLVSKVVGSIMGIIQFGTGLLTVVIAEYLLMLLISYLSAKSNLE